MKADPDVTTWLWSQPPNAASSQTRTLLRPHLSAITRQGKISSPYNRLNSASRGLVNEHIRGLETRFKFDTQKSLQVQYDITSPRSIGSSISQRFCPITEVGHWSPAWAPDPGRDITLGVSGTRGGRVLPTEGGGYSVQPR